LEKARLQKTGTQIYPKPWDGNQDAAMIPKNL
jgi:hypothetical protein